MIYYIALHCIQIFIQYAAVDCYVDLIIDKISLSWKHHKK